MSRSMTWRPEQIWLAVAGLIVLVALLLGAGYVVRKHHWTTQTLDTANPRIARLTGLLQSGDTLAAAEAELQTHLNALAYPATEAAGDIGSAALQRVRDTATARGLRITSSQTAVAPESPEGFERINLELRTESDWAAVQTLLRELHALRPAVYLGTLGFSAQQRGNEAQVIQTQWSLFVLRQKT